MDSSKIVRTICLFRDKFIGTEEADLAAISDKLKDSGYIVQTNRICSPKGFGEMDNFSDNILVSVGTVEYSYARENLRIFYSSKDNFNIELSKTEIELEHVDILFEIIKNSPSKTFNFAYVFNNSPSSPYMPSATYKKDGFSIGLQPTDLAKDSDSLEDWFEKLEEVYNEIANIFRDDEGFLGIDSSIAPLFENESSLINFINKLDSKGFSHSTTTDIYTRITNFIKNRNPRVIGLSGIMLPCLEDFELAREYENGNFTIERNIYLSLHSGLGIDTYPIGIDEDPYRVLEILRLVQALSNKYSKPLSVRFVSDGKAKIGDKSDLQNQYLYDVVIKKL